jgi:hypothetical protein
MRYLLLIATEPPASPPTADDWGQMLAEYGAYTRWLQEAGWYVGAEALQDPSTATTVSVVDGRRIITDGPFAETKEQLGGYYVIDVPSLDDALDAAARLPGAKVGRVEVRPIQETGG